MFQQVASFILLLSIVLVPVVIATQQTSAQTLSVLYTFTGGSDGGGPEAGLIRDARGNLYGTTSFGGGSDAMRVDVNLAPDVPISSLSVQTGATNARVDLSTLKVTSLDMSVGAATVWIRLPEAAGTTVAHISSGAATVTLEIPLGVAAQIHHKGGLSTVDIDQTRFPPVSDGLYRSPDFGTAKNTVDVSIDSGFTTIEVH